ncbi:Ig-like domain-containing protein [Catelliglobosispora koreensis]|uniref:Ig-like domain-containing protein n=1 Tax=Catelliglobosispora koreensis TaxID=129052 RepID=UPI00037CE2FB|nr:Ig-like domain-containing protein [Catelliglobosispora koreensis]
MSARLGVAALLGVTIAGGPMLASPAFAAAPSVTINQGLSQVDPASTTPITFTVQFSETVTGFDATDVTLGGTAGGSLAAAVSGSGAAYTVTVTGMTTGGTVTASIAAGAAANGSGEASEASTSTDNTVTWETDNTAPMVSINQAMSQVDPTSVSPIAFAVQFSEPVTGFDATDVAISGTAGGSLTPSITGSGAAYTVTVTGMTTGGTVIATVPASAATDAAGNPSGASTSVDNTVTWAPGPLSVTINQGPSQVDPTSTTPITFAVQFSEPVTGFDAADVTLSGTAGGSLTANVSGDGAAYTVMVSGMTSEGTVVAAIPAGAATNATGTPNTASTSADNTVTWQPPATTPTPASPTPTATGTTPVNGGMPLTGANIMFMISAALGLLIAGAAVLLVARRRRPADL